MYLVTLSAVTQMFSNYSFFIYPSVTAYLSIPLLQLINISLCSITAYSFIPLLHNCSVTTTSLFIPLLQLINLSLCYSLLIYPSVTTYLFIPLLQLINLSLSETNVTFATFYVFDLFQEMVHFEYIRLDCYDYK